MGCLYRYMCLLTVLFLPEVLSQGPTVSIRQCEVTEPPFQDADTFTPSPAGGCSRGVPDNYTQVQLDCVVTGVMEEVTIQWYRGVENAEVVEPHSEVVEPQDNDSYKVTVTILEEVARITTMETYSCIAAGTEINDTARETIISIYRISVVETVEEEVETEQFAGRPIYLTILIVAVVLVVVLIIYGLYRCKKRDEGSYPVNEPMKDKQRDETGKLVVEFYA